MRAANDPVKVSEVARINEERLARLQAIETSDENDPLEDMVGHFLAAAVRWSCVELACSASCLISCFMRSFPG